MLMILKTAEELKELVYEAKERACLALEYKEDCPALASAYIDIANNGLSQADKLHAALVDTISRLKSKDTVPDKMMDMWTYEHKCYIEMYEKAKLKIQMYSKF